MHAIGRLKRLVYAAVVAAVFILQAGHAQAGLVSTDLVFQNAEIVANAQQDVLRMLDRQVVIDELEAMGVDPAAVRQRVANLTEEELAELEKNLDSLPAGGIDVLGAALLVFFVLLITDIAGLTDIFPFVKKD